MRAKIRKYYYFKNLDKLIVEFCKGCSICRQNKSRRGRLIGEMSRIGPATAPYEVMSIDTAGGFAGNRSPKKFMHILVDHFSRYAWISTAKTQSSKDFISLINKVAKDNHIKLILADQYTGLTSNALKNYLDRIGTKLVYSSIDCPTSNGLNERLNQTLVNRIRCKVNEGDRRAWSVIADECVENYNSTIHSATKYEPKYLLFGQQTHISPLGSLTASDLSEDRKQAFINSSKNFEENKTRIDKHRVTYSFQTGDLVYIENGNKINRNKMDQVRVGPFKVLRRISNSIYELDCGKKRRESNYFHSSKLSPFAPQKVT